MRAGVESGFDDSRKEQILILLIKTYQAASWFSTGLRGRTLKEDDCREAEARLLRSGFKSEGMI